MVVEFLFCLSKFFKKQLVILVQYRQQACRLGFTGAVAIRMRNFKGSSGIHLWSGNSD